MAGQWLATVVIVALLLVTANDNGVQYNKKQDGVSELYSLVEFKDEEGNKVRRDEALAKNKLTGNYGAIPALKPMKMLKGRTADGK